MNIILLSGGSGKRLWPLSNEVRAKQFLKVLRDPEGNPESMLQRVYRQIRESGLKAQIAIATCASQVSLIRRQLGEAVDIVVEPERRNTFPAIALSAVYLSDIKRVDREETVIVMPVDVYAETEYFRTFRKMERALKETKANLALMGIQPTAPSEKFGYIVPDAGTGSLVAEMVSRFAEKPSQKEAERLIEDGAVWNGGVFAFRLGWMLDIVHSCVGTSGFGELTQRYGELTKNSFDYEVVEKESSIAMVRYCGIWEDLGTWDTLTAAMHLSSAGKVVEGEGNRDTYIINELEIPTVVLGAEHMVVCATPDGILVADRDKATNLKNYAESIHLRPMYERRFWGEYQVLDYRVTQNQEKSLTKRLTIEAGKNISYQYHLLRDEIWTITDGEGEVVLDGECRRVRRGDVVYIKAGTKHAIRGVNDLNLIEVQIGQELSEEDIIRIAYGWQEIAIT